MSSCSVIEEDNTALPPQGVGTSKIQKKMSVLNEIDLEKQTAIAEAELFDTELPTQKANGMAEEKKFEELTERQYDKMYSNFIYPMLSLIYKEGSNKVDLDW